MHVALHLLLQLGGVNRPIVAALGTVALAVGRLLYASGYSGPAGPNGRLGGLFLGLLVRSNI